MSYFTFMAVPTLYACTNIHVCMCIAWIHSHSCRERHYMWSGTFMVRHTLYAT